MIRVEIRVKGRLDETWSEWFDGLTISHSGPDETLLSGSVQDQTAIFGILARLRDLGLELDSVITDSCSEGQTAKRLNLHPEDPAGRLA